MCLFNDADPCAKKKCVDISVEKDYYDARIRFRNAHAYEEDGLDDKHEANHAVIASKETSKGSRASSKEDRQG